MQHLMEQVFTSLRGWRHKWDKGLLSTGNHYFWHTAFNTDNVWSFQETYMQPHLPLVFGTHNVVLIQTKLQPKIHHPYYTLYHPATCIWHMGKMKGKWQPRGSPLLEFTGVFTENCRLYVLIKNVLYLHSLFYDNYKFRNNVTNKTDLYFIRKVLLTECNISYWPQTKLHKAVCHGFMSMFCQAQFTFSDRKINKVAWRFKTALKKYGVHVHHTYFKLCAQYFRVITIFLNPKF